MSSRWTLTASLAVALATIACGGPVVAQGPPLTPVVLLPLEWTPTPAAAVNLPAGWEPLLGAGVELWLPASFDGGDPATRRDALIENLRALGTGYEDLAAILESYAPGLLFFAFDTGLAGATVAITRRDLPAAVPMSEYLEVVVAELPGVIPGVVVLDHGTMTVQGEDVGKVKMEITTQASTATQVSYIFHRGDSVYTVGYAVPQELFPEAEPAFEVSSGSFRLTQ
jgi:hypothetical protein